LEQVLVRQELDCKQEDDLLVTNINGDIVETSCANIFWVQAGKYYTPDLSQSGVEGLVRNFVLKNIPGIHIVKMKLAALNDAEAMFICNSVMGIVPVRRYQNRDLNLNAVLKFKNMLAGHIKC